MSKIKRFNEFLNESEKTPFEITSVKGMPLEKATKLISDNYAHNLSYRGEEFFDKIYMGILAEFSYTKMEIGKSYSYTETDPDTGESYEEQEEISGQESYLGYLPDEDVFIEGYDMFGDSGFGNVVFIKLDEKLNPQDVTNEKQFHFSNPGGMMYGRNGGTFKCLHAQFKALIDIRLD